MSINEDFDEEKLADAESCLWPKISERELLCIDQCGFYGTPQREGRCSMCWRIHSIESKKRSDYNKNRALLTQDSAGSIIRKSSDVIRFNSIRSILKKSPSVFSSGYSPSFVQDDTIKNLPLTSVSPVFAPSSSRSLSPDSRESRTHLKTYLYETFSLPIARDVDKQCREFLQKLFQNESCSPEELSEMVQQFYENLGNKVLKIKPLPDHFKQSEFVAELENFICNCAYLILFCTRSDEEAADLLLQERIRSLNWVTLGFLETALDFSSDQVQELLYEAITQIVELNSHRSVVKKLDCLIKCSKFIFDALKESRSGVTSADEFLPVLIFVVLKANPPLIQSNLKFISRFSLPYRVLRGETGYYFTNLSCAIQFIQDMNAKSLKMNEEEFDAYTQGKRVAPVKMSGSVIKSIEQSLKRLNYPLENHADFDDKMRELEKKIQQDACLFKDAVKSFIELQPSLEVQNVTLNLALEDSLSDGNALNMDPLSNSLPTN